MTVEVGAAVMTVGAAPRPITDPPAPDAASDGAPSVWFAAVAAAVAAPTAGEALLCAHQPDKMDGARSPSAADAADEGT